MGRRRSSPNRTVQPRAIDLTYIDDSKFHIQKTAYLLGAAFAQDALSDFHNSAITYCSGPFLELSTVSELIRRYADRA